MELRERQQAAIRNAMARARMLRAGDELWIEEVTPAGRAAFGLSVNK
jgi:hypothetical protein